MSHTVELIVVNADTRRPVIDIDPITIPAPIRRARWARTDAPGLAAFIQTAHNIAHDTDTNVDIVATDEPARSFDGGCGDCARAGRSGFARMIDMIPEGDRVLCPTCR